MMDLNLLIGDYLEYRNSGGAAYLPFPDASSGWDNSLVHLSDIGHCPRQVILRLSNAKIRRESLRIALKETRFFMGHVMHNLLYNALLHYDATHDGPILSYGQEIHLQPYIEDYGLERVSGTLDSILNPKVLFEDESLRELIVLDCKSMHPNLLRNMRDKLPLEQHGYQVSAYTFFLNYAIENGMMGMQSDRLEPPAIAYFDNGGGDNPYEFCQLEQNDFINKRATAMFLLGELIGCRSSFERDNTIPPILDRRIYVKGKRYPEVRYGPAWDCNEKYCPYIHASCFPDERDSLVACYSKKQGIQLGEGHKEIKEHGLGDELERILTETY